MTHRRGFLAAVLVAALAVAAGPAAAKRAGPRPVAPVVLGGVRFEAPPWAAANGLGQNGGVVVARDAATGAALWSAKVYTVAYDHDMEADVQDVFIVTMAPSPDGKALLVVDERGRRWRLDLATRAAAPDATR